MQIVDTETRRKRFGLMAEILFRSSPERNRVERDWLGNVSNGLLVDSLFFKCPIPEVVFTSAVKAILKDINFKTDLDQVAVGRIRNLVAATVIFFPKRFECFLAEKVADDALAEESIKSTILYSVTLGFFDGLIHCDMWFLDRDTILTDLTNAFCRTLADGQDVKPMPECISGGFSNTAGAFFRNGVIDSVGRFVLKFCGNPIWATCSSWEGTLAGQIINEVATKAFGLLPLLAKTSLAGSAFGNKLVSG